MGALLDTSVVIDLDQEAVASQLPEEVSISTVTLAELAVGPQLAQTRVEQARRQFRLQQIESIFEPRVFDADAARAFGQIVAAVVGAERSHRRRIADLMIAATAMACRLDLYTRNPEDFEGLEQLITVCVV
jgi:predicted nucleic acid-binding protein